MIGSLWRYSHFILAVVSALFLIIASVTGALLALEPIVEKVQPYASANLDEIQLSEIIVVLRKNYTEVLALEVTPEDFVKASVITKEGASETIYIDPSTGEKLGNVIPQSSFFNFITNLHRSLFLKSIGRGFVGIVSFLLCFIAVTGMFLLAQRQGGFKKWFTKVQETNFAQRYHVILGRWFLVPILIIAATGVYLSAEKFSLLPDSFIEHDWSAISAKEAIDNPILSKALFQNYDVSEVRKLIFPFSEDPEDYFQLALQNKELLVHQYTGEVVSEVHYPFVQLVSKLSMQLHTGQGNIVWSVILLVASLSLLFFIFSGLAMSFKRRRKTKFLTTEWTKDEAEYILLVGSETGSTYTFANTFYTALRNEGKKVFVATLNEYNTYINATHFIVFTATYGDGDAPTNAREFETLFTAIKPIRGLHFSVLGFGAMLYPKYCEFALKIDKLLQNHSSFLPRTAIGKINDQSQSDFADWIKTWNKSTGMNLMIKFPCQKKKPQKEQFFKVIKRTNLNVDNTALLQLRPNKNAGFQSGDLLNIIPPEGNYVRQYSIAKIDGDILLSIKWHPHGVCSTYLCTLKVNDTISAHIEKNEKFHFPKKASVVWLIANGTGIAPYLGMLRENYKTPIKLTWGGRTAASFNCYHEILERNHSSKNTVEHQLAFSKTKEKEYVQDILQKQQIKVASTLKEGGVFMLCGSMAMQHAVLDALEEITATQLQQPLSDFENNGQVLTDCY